MVVDSLSQVTKKAKNSFVNYIVGLIATSGKKTCTNIAESCSVSHDKIYRTLQSATNSREPISDILIGIVKKLFPKEKGWLVLDDSLIAKPFAKFIEGVCLGYSSLLGLPQYGISVVVVVWTNGFVTIPIDFKIWIKREIVKEDYVTKRELAQQMIEAIVKKLKIKGVLMDGLYCSLDMILFLDKRNIRFEMRIASNRKVIAKGGIEAQLKHNKGVLPRRNERSRTTRVIWKGVKLWITAEKRKVANGEYETVFIASNYKAEAKEHIFIYSIRWVIERFFRTAKQTLGLQDCAARDVEKQKAHIYGVLISYAYLQYEKFTNGFETVEDAAKQLRHLKFDVAIQRMRSAAQNIGVFA